MNLTEALYEIECEAIASVLGDVDAEMDDPAELHGASPDRAESAKRQLAPGYVSMRQ